MTSNNLGKYINFIKNNLKSMPSSKKDIERYSQLHSWYKHLGDLTIAYPILMKGEEPYSNFKPHFSDVNQENFHWRIVFDYNLDEYPIYIDDVYHESIPHDILHFMKQFPIYLDRDFGSYDRAGPFQNILCNSMCEKFWLEVTKFK
jgi:hypothetical protein